MKGLLDNPLIIDRLRKLRPYYDRIFSRRPTLVEGEGAKTLSELDGNAIFMLSFGRSGTTVFSDLLATHPDIVTVGEVLNEDAFRCYFRKAKRLRRGWRPSVVGHGFYGFVRDQVRRRRGKKVLFDMKFESLHTIEGNWHAPGLNYKLFDALIESKAPTILLWRDDHVARHLSHEIASRTGRFHSFQGDVEANEPFYIDIEEMDNSIKAIQAQLSFVRERFATHPRFLACRYEDMFEKTGEIRQFSAELTRRLAATLEVEDAFDRVPRLQKLASAKQETLIANSDEVAAYRDGKLPR